MALVTSGVFDIPDFVLGVANVRLRLCGTAGCTADIPAPFA